MAKATNKTAPKKAETAAPKKAATKSAPSKASASKPEVKESASKSKSVPQKIKWSAVPFEAAYEKTDENGNHYKYTKVPDGHKFENKTVVMTDEILAKLLGNKTILEVK